MRNGAKGSNFSHVSPFTVITCEPPTTNLHTSYTPVQPTHDWNTTVDYMCDSDYHYINGSFQSVCNESGSFPQSDILDCSGNCYVNNDLISYTST